jgi:Cu(I)/Ag(I) efflux system membrane fusion protein
MQTRSIFFSVLFAATSFAFLANCSGDQKQDATEAHEEHQGHDEAEHSSGSSQAAEATEPQFQVDQKFQEQLGSVFSSYIELKEAFVDSDAKQVQSEARETKDALAKVDMKLVSGAAHNDWMSYLTPIQNSLNEIQSAADIEAQRKSFSMLSDNLYKSVKAFGLGGREAFYEYCPMAFNNEGAYWLSDQEKIRNPYFGDKMLTCGEVKEKLK